MAGPKRKNISPEAEQLHRLTEELGEVRMKLQECEDTLSAIRSGGVDAIVVSGPGEERVFTLAGTENAYRVFVEAMDDAAITVNSGGTVMYANKAFAKLLGKPLETLIGGSIFDIIPASDRSEFDAVFREARNNAGGRCELTLSRDNGDSVPVFVSARSCVEFGAEAICMVMTDLSEQKRNEQIVADGQLARLVLRHASEAMAVCDCTGKILHCNPAFQTVCATNPLLCNFDDALRLEIVDGQPRRNTVRDSLHFRVRDAIAGQEFRGIEVRLRGDNGESTHLLLTSSPVLLPTMERAGVLITLFNIEERRRTEDALRRSEKLAATGRLAASIAHEINNPLAALTNLVYLIQTEARSPKIAAYAETAQEELARVAHITRQTLAFYRESANPADTSPVDLIESALFLYASSIRNKNLTVRREFEFTGKLHGYPNELRQVFSNVLANAVEALPKDGMLRIRTYESREWSNSRKPGVRIVIGDTGHGIKVEHQRRLFEPFFTTKAEKGTGLGLWVSQGIIEKHGGFIRLRSSTDANHHGTVFGIFIPSYGVMGREAAA